MKSPEIGIAALRSARPVVEVRPNRCYSFGPFRLDPQSRVFTKDGVPIPLTAKAMEVLLLLLDRSGETVTKSELRTGVWGSAVVDDNNLNQCVSAIRKALGERPGEHRYILTVTGVGYRFIAPVTVGLKAEPEEKSVKPSFSPRLSSVAATSRAVHGVMAALLLAVVASAWIAQHRPAPLVMPATLGPLPHDSQALEFYLEGRRVARERFLPNLNRAINLFQRAVDKDPNFALAYAGLADIYAVRAADGQAEPETIQLAEAAARKALALDPALAEAHVSLGLVNYARWDWKEAEREYADALRIDPSNARALMRSAMVSFVMGRFPEGESRLHEAQLLNPSDGAIAGMLCELYYYWRRYDDCIRMADRILQFDPANAGFAYLRKAEVLVREGRYAEAEVAAQHYAKSSPPNDVTAQVLTASVEARGDKARFEKRFQEILKAHPSQYFSPYNLACMYAAAGDKENAFRQLEIAYREHITDLVSLKWEPGFDSIRSDSRYANLLARMGL
ncbi:MAG TPA: winged helix-turn-helix domain-containing protein [Bryobacteraceae bacterium]|jgi:DNA-binding winged helix-turn-helix (wHTH) protein/Flp pilus assembly protein TadD|nr:winged helix-turn-helix domain-containing protein [Bryobacteraceae bacterium]